MEADNVQEHESGAQQVSEAIPNQETPSKLVSIPIIVLPGSAQQQDATPKQAGQQTEERIQTEEQAEHEESQELEHSGFVKEAEFITQATSWAKMAGTLGDSSKTIDLKPENKPSGAAPRLKPVGRIPQVEKRGEPLANQMRLVFLMNLPSNITLTDISDGIQEGPLVSITFNNDADTGSRFAGIIFQNAEDAEAFHKVLCNEKIAKAPERFKFIADSAISEIPVPASVQIHSN